MLIISTAAELGGDLHHRASSGDSRYAEGKSPARERQAGPLGFVAKPDREHRDDEQAADRFPVLSNVMTTAITTAVYASRRITQRVYDRCHSDIKHVVHRMVAAGFVVAV